VQIAANPATQTQTLQEATMLRRFEVNAQKPPDQLDGQPRLSAEVGDNVVHEAASCIILAQHS
jgi:hypothetical protein